ncbi:hypothetical protein [Arthrobacter sp. KBS0703]|uniref:hypothetical protein n=1 Tax=Arthrobacter sp. KBS0703 TaxID=1955698 RepID=UPI00163D806E|nr:hypothetical protein [Arthrobacter sp. KBS0703]
MTTSQNRQPKGITTGGQFAPDAHAESTLLLDPATRDIVLSPGESESFQELADSDVIETLNVNRSDDGSGYWISPAKTVNITEKSSLKWARPTLCWGMRELSLADNRGILRYLLERERRGFKSPWYRLDEHRQLPERMTGRTSSQGTAAKRPHTHPSG